MNYEAEAINLLREAVENRGLCKADAYDILELFLEECEDTSPNTAMEKIANDIEECLGE
jgi:hypothetical protein